MAAPAQAPAPGAFYGLPGYTSWTEQKENNDQAAVTLQAATQAPFSAVVPFKTTDVVLWWELEITWANTMSIGTGVINTSPYFPYNILGPTKLQIQNQYPAMDAQSGIDIALFQLIRPARTTDNLAQNILGTAATAWYANPQQFQPALDADLADPNILLFAANITPASAAAITATEQSFATFTAGPPGPNVGTAQQAAGILATDIAIGVTMNVGVGTNKVVAAPTLGVGLTSARVTAASTVGITWINPTAGALTPTAGFYTVAVYRPADANVSATIRYTLELPGGIYFDDYYDLSKDGAMTAQPHRAFVSPTFMASTARSVQPDIRFQPGFAATLDQGPFFQQTAGTSAFAASTATMGWRRIGIYGANNAALMPVVYNWQLVRQAKNINLGGVTQKDLPVQTWGQILCLMLRFFDPNVANGGAPLDLASNISKAQVQYGSGLLRFDDTARSAQRRLIKQHGFLPPPGIIIWDLAIDDQNRLTNRRALNTLTTAGVNIHLEFIAALSATCYVVLLTEYLAYVE